MTKKSDFLLTTKEPDCFDAIKLTSEPFIDYFDRMKTMMPDRAFTKGDPRWELNKTCNGDKFMNTAGQEDDVYDINYLKYMRTRERGMIKPQPLCPIFNLPKRDFA
jgi:hypothetical protein